MAESLTRNGTRLLLILAAFAGVCHRSTRGAEPDYRLNLPLVFDPASKKYFIGGSAKFVLKSSESNAVVDRIELAVDGSDFRPYDEPVQFDKEGKHTLRFRAKNPVNNWSPVQFTEVFVDLTAPLTEVKWPDKGMAKDGDRIYLAVGAPIHFVAQDNLSGVGRIEYSWDDSSFLPFVKAILAEKLGRQTIFYRSIDKVGNAETVKKIEFTVDGTPPVSAMKLQGTAKPIVAGGKNYLGVSDSAGFAIEANDEISAVKQIWVSVDGGSWTPYIKTIYFLQDGPHTLAYYGEDLVGNKEAPKTVQVYTVSVAPRTVATTLGRVVNTAGVNFASRDFQLKLEAKDNIIGLDRIEVREDDESDFRTYVEPIRFTRPGLHSVSYRAVDRAGNVEPTRVFSVMVHTTPPETVMNTSSPLVLRDGITYSQAPNVLSFIVTNSTVGVESTMVSVDDGPFQPYKGPMTITADKKVHKIVYRSVDRLGNEEPAKTVGLNMITLNPIVDLFVSDGRSNEEKLRTNFFEGAPAPEPPARDVASPRTVTPPSLSPAPAAGKPGTKGAPTRKPAGRKKR